MNKKELNEFIENSTKQIQNIKETSRKECIDILAKVKEVEFDSNGDTPCYNSNKGYEDSGVTDANISRVYLKDGFVYVDVDFYYDPSEYRNDILADDEPEFDWLELLRYLQFYAE